MEDTFSLFRPLFDFALNEPRATYDDLSARCLLYAQASQQVALHAASGDCRAEGEWREVVGKRLADLREALAAVQLPA